MTAGTSKPKLRPEQATFPPERTLHWPRTDARGRERYPTNTQERVNSEGIYDFFKLLEPLDAVHFEWRRKTGTFLAEKVEAKPSIEGGYVMSDFPMGYEFYDHHKGPPGNPRHDVYLFGPVNNAKKIWRFRSVPEFLPHARWLYDVNSEEPCQCKYCSGVKHQREITATLDVAHLFQRGRPSGSGTGHIRKPRTITQRPATQGKRPTLPRGPPSHVVLDTPPDHVHGELHADLTSGKSYRKGEVVWAAVKPPIVGSSANEMIYFWPAVVSGRHVKIEQSYAGNRNEVHMYDIRYFPHAQNHVLAETDIIPLQAYRVPQGLTVSVSRFRPAPDSDYQTCMEIWKAFRVLRQSAYDAECDNALPNFHDATPAYMVAVRLSDYITQLYRPDLEWDKDSSPFQPASNSRSRRASRHASPQPADQSKSTSSFADRRLYQGMWWGTERIWMGDLVRLIPERSHFLDDTQSRFRPPAPPPFSTGRPGVFMHIELIHSGSQANTADQDATQVTGTLWETVSEHWTEPEDDITALAQQQSVNPSDPNSDKDRAPQDGPIPAAPPQKKPMTLLDAYPLPPPPPRSKWRPILVSGMEATIPVNLIAGRYYPNILKHPVVGLGDSLLDQLLPLEPPAAAAAALVMPTDGTISPMALFSPPNPSRSSPASLSAINPSNTSEPIDPAVERILALAGLGRAWFHGLETNDTKYLSLDRVEMLQQALKASCEEIWAWFQTPLQDSQQVAPYPTA